MSDTKAIQSGKYTPEWIFFQCQGFMLMRISDILKHFVFTYYTVMYISFEIVKFNVSETDT